MEQEGVGKRNNQPAQYIGLADAIITYPQRQRKVRAYAKDIVISVTKGVIGWNDPEYLSMYVNRALQQARVGGKGRNKLDPNNITVEFTNFRA